MKQNSPFPPESSPLPLLYPAPIPGGFNEPAAADVLLHLHSDDPESIHYLDLHLLFVAPHSDGWQPPGRAGDEMRQISLKIPHAGDRPFDLHVADLHLLHTFDFAGAIQSVADALVLLPVALELLLDDCVRLLEVVPWTEKEEEVVSLIPFPREEGSRDLLARVSPKVAAGDGSSMSEEVLGALIHSAIQGLPNVATVKAFVAKLLINYPSLGLLWSVLDQAFSSSLETVKDSLRKYASPNFRAAGSDARGIASQMSTGQKSVVQELEETFLRIVSTRPMSERCSRIAAECLSFSTRNVDDHPHLTSEF